MPCVANGLYVVQGEVAILLAAMRRGSRWSSHSLQDSNQDVLVQSLTDLKEALNQLRDLKDLDPSHYFGPFLEIIRAGGTTGPVTSIALSAIHKFLAHKLIDVRCKNTPATLDHIADAVTHTKFVSTDQNSDGVVLLKIVQVLRCLVISSLGALLTHESMCEIMLSCFRICFEHRLTEHIRKSAEFSLREIVHHLFTRLPEFPEDTGTSSHGVRKIKMTKGMESAKSNKKYSLAEDTKSKVVTQDSETNIVDIQGEIHQDVKFDTGSTATDITNSESSPAATDNIPVSSESEDTKSDSTDVSELMKNLTVEDVPAAEEYVNQQGVRFKVAAQSTESDNDTRRLVPYGTSWVRELFRFLVSLCNPLDKMNSDTMVHVGLTLVEVVLEVSADALGRYSSLLELVKDELCRNLFALLQSDRLSIFALDIQVCFLLFESLRTHLKFQLESYLTRLTEIIVSDSGKITFDQKEIALEGVVQLWRVPGLVTELYLNYDCDLYCPNLFEDITKLLSKNVFPLTNIYSTNLLSLDALLTIIDTVEKHCHSRILNERQTVDTLVVPPSGDARHSVSNQIPSHEQLMAVKRKKKLLISGTQQFNVNPKKGIQFLQDNHLMKQPLDPQEVVFFLRENPRLDKKMIGDYISVRGNIDVLAAFVKSFEFTDMRIDEALRLFLETFRLPGESPLIAMIMEYFADHWHKSNGEPFTNADAAFTLAYAVIMLNVDQHNHNVKRQNIPMSNEGFKKNLKSVNGGQDFDQAMLDDIYEAIKNEEIVMPAEQTGLVKENYLWKTLLRRGASKDGVFIHAPEGLYDHDLFSLIWGPTNAALSFVFDKSLDPAIYRKAISGFRKCAMISAHYGMSSDFDSLISSLSKFTLLTSSAESPDNVTVAFGSNAKAQLAAQTLFHLIHRHGEILREGWATVLDLILVLYKCRLLPSPLVEAEDFLEVGGKIKLIREEAPIQKAETGILSSLYLYIALGEGGRAPGPEEQEAMHNARDCIQDCRVESIVSESKFLRVEALVELVKAIIAASPECTARANTDTAVFFLELIIKVVMPNRDRLESVWGVVRDHLYSVMMSGSACENHLLTERAIVGLLRLAIHLMRREDLSGMLLQSLRMLLLLKPATLQRNARQISYGLNELIKTSAANIHTTTDWTIIFTLLECVGAGSPPPRLVGDVSDQGSAVPWAFAPPPTRPKLQQGLGDGTKSDGDVHSGGEDSGLGGERGCTSEPEPQQTTGAAGGWILVGRAGDLQPLNPRGINYFDLGSELNAHDPYALVKCCETLAFLVRDVAHITPFNYKVAVQCIRIFVEASLDGANRKPHKKNQTGKDKNVRKKAPKRREGRNAQSQSPTSAYDADESDEEDVPSGYQLVTIQLLDLMHTLHTRTAQIHRWWAEEGETRPDVESLWQYGWCPLLQGIARLCCDTRKQVRMTAITYLQRALLVHDLQTLKADEWQSCFTFVLFPLLTKLLELSVPDEVHLEETRVRAATVLSKVFLHHLTPLLSLPTFATLWLNILDLMATYMQVDKSDLLMEAIPESLKNMLLVMDSTQIFGSADERLPLWDLTWNRIGSFLPGLQEEFFKAQSLVPKQPDLQMPASASTLPSEGVAPQADDLNRAVVVAKAEDSVEVLIGSQGQSIYQGSSIILQPPPHTYTSPVFNHNGQQMTTTVLAADPVPIVLPHSTQLPPVLCHLDEVPPFDSSANPESASSQLPLPLQEAHPAWLPVDKSGCPQTASGSLDPSPVLVKPVTPHRRTAAPFVMQPPEPTNHSCVVNAAVHSPAIFGSHPSAFVPYVSPQVEASKHNIPDGMDVSSQSTPEKSASSADSVLNLEFYPLPTSLPEGDFTASPQKKIAIDQTDKLLLGSLNESTAGCESNERINEPLHRDSSISIPLYIPVQSNITAPVQMYSGSRAVTAESSLIAASALSQYFNVNQNRDVFDDLVASSDQPNH